MAQIILNKTNYPNCVEDKLNLKKICLNDPRSSAIYFENNLPAPREFERIRIDGCVFGKRDKCPRCDWLLRFNHAGHSNEIYVELKGGDITRAVKQLAETIERVSFSQAQKHSYIVCTNNPLNSVKMSNLKVKFKKYHDSSLEAVRNKSTVRLIKN